MSLETRPKKLPLGVGAIAHYGDELLAQYFGVLSKAEQLIIPVDFHNARVIADEDPELASVINLNLGIIPRIHDPRWGAAFSRSLVIAHDYNSAFLAFPYEPKRLMMSTIAAISHMIHEMNPEIDKLRRVNLKSSQELIKMRSLSAGISDGLTRWMLVEASNNEYGLSEEQKREKHLKLLAIKYQLHLEQYPTTREEGNLENVLSKPANYGQLLAETVVRKLRRNGKRYDEAFSFLISNATDVNEFTSYDEDFIDNTKAVLLLI